MGCDSYSASRWENGGWGEASVSLDYDSEEFPCVCTLHGDSHNGAAFSAGDIRSLAAIGAAVVLAHHGDLTTDYITTPAQLPDRLVAAIRYFVQ